MRVRERGMKGGHNQEEVGDEEVAATGLWHPSELTGVFFERRGGGRLARMESILQHPLCSAP